MTEREREGPSPPDSEEAGMGEPIALLRDYGEEPAAGFLERIRGALQRRLFAAQIVDLSWFTPVLLVIEYLKFFFGFFERGRPEEGDRS